MRYCNGLDTALWGSSWVRDRIDHRHEASPQSETGRENRTMSSQWYGSFSAWQAETMARGLTCYPILFGAGEKQIYQAMDKDGRSHGVWNITDKKGYLASGQRTADPSDTRKVTP